MADFEAKLSPRQREIYRKVDEGVWQDDWSARVREQTPETMAERFDQAKCKPRPTDSRVNRGSGAGKHDAEKPGFIPWCERKR